VSHPGIIDTQNLPAKKLTANKKLNTAQDRPGPSGSKKSGKGKPTRKRSAEKSDSEGDEEEPAPWNPKNLRRPQVGAPKKPRFEK
jgi:hypothetical protein